MADGQKRYYRTSGAAAYDVYSPYNNNTARPLPRQPQGLPEERPLPQREQRVNVAKLETKLQSLQQQHAVLESKYEGRIDLAEIEKRAGELGLWM